MTLSNKKINVFTEIIDYAILIYTVSTLLILILKFELFSGSIQKIDFSLFYKHPKEILIFIITMLIISLLGFFLKKIKPISILIIILFCSIYSFYLYYNLYVLYDTCACQSLFSFLSLKRNYHLSNIISFLGLISFIAVIYDRIKQHN